MHFSIPDTQELNEGNGSTYIGYNIHINGVFHCTLRYKQLHHLNEQLRREFGGERLPSFPPKKLLPLTIVQLEERRASLEKYIQLVGQDFYLVSSDILIGLLLFAQQETTCEKQEEIHLDIHTANNYQISLSASTFDRTEQVLAKLCKQISLPLKYMPLFALYLVKNDSEEFVILRKLLNFESPYISHRAMQGPNKIVILKSYWDPIYDLELIKDPVTLNLLYIQTVSDVEKGWIICTKDTKSQLSRLYETLSKLEYIELASSLKYYGYTQFKPCFCDFPKPQTKVLVSIGGGELNIRLVGNQLVKEGAFKVTRMKCWRITATHQKQETATNSQNIDNSVELSFEYLMSKDKLQWITITSDQAIFMSVCLQSLVDELLSRKNNGAKKRIQLMNRNLFYMRRDGTILRMSLEGIDSDEIDDPSFEFHESFSIKKLQEKFSIVSFKNGREFIENNAFEGIGDEDL